MSIGIPIAYRVNHVNPVYSSPAAHRRHDADFRISFDPSLQHLIAPNYFAVYKDVDMRAHFTLLSQYAIEQSPMSSPQLAQGFTHIGRRTVEPDFCLTAGEFGQVACDLKGDHRRFRFSPIVTEQVGEVYIATGGLVS